MKIERMLRWGVIALAVALVVVCTQSCASEALNAIQDAGWDIDEAQDAISALDDKSQKLATDLASDASTLRDVAPQIADDDARDTVENVAGNLDGHVTTVSQLRGDAQDALIALASASANTDDAEAFTAPSAAIEEGANAATGGLWYWLLGGTGIAGAAGAIIKRRVRKRRERRRYRNDYEQDRYEQPRETTENGSTNDTVDATGGDNAPADDGGDAAGNGDATV